MGTCCSSLRNNGHIDNIPLKVEQPNTDDEDEMGNDFNTSNLDSHKNDIFSKDHEIYNSKYKKFILDLVHEINFARTKPLKYSEKIKTHIDYIFIKPESESQKIFYYYFYNKNLNFPKVNLMNGANSFMDCVEILHNTQSMLPLQLNKEIEIDIPSNFEESNQRNSIIVKLVLKKKQELFKEQKIKEFNFHYDLGALNAEISTILQLVDDNNSLGIRRGNLLNPIYKYIGVSIKKVQNKQYYIFLSFAS
jgi:hypothetical protein